MDVLSLIGVILAFVAILGGNYLEGGHAGALLNGPAALIVIGGTLLGQPVVVDNKAGAGGQDRGGLSIHRERPDAEDDHAHEATEHRRQRVEVRELLAPGVKSLFADLQGHRLGESAAREIAVCDVEGG